MRSVSGQQGPRVLVLGSRPDVTEDVDRATVDTLRLRVTVAGPGLSADGSEPFDLLPVQAAYGLRPRTLAAAVKARLTARRAGLPGDWLWQVKSDAALRRAVREADVVISADEPTDGVLEQVPEIVGERCTVRSAARRDVWRGLRQLGRTLRLLEAEYLARLVDGRVSRRPLDHDVLTELRQGVDPVLARAVPAALLPVGAMTDVARCLASTVGADLAAAVLLDLLGDLPWEAAPDAGPSGLLAQWFTARIWRADHEAEFPPEQMLKDAADAALAGADEAFAAGDRNLARGRLVDALALLFHRERHADSLRSPLVEQPAAYLERLYASPSFDSVVRGRRRPRVGGAVARPQGEPPRVLVLGGAYGSFHGGVVEALSPVATVTVRRPRRLDPFLAGKAMEPQALDALATLRGTGPSSQADFWSVHALNDTVRRALAPRLRRADVVFTDWADRLTVWASHLVPDGCRLVVRIHSLDALHPWFHLVDWSAVDHVVVVSEPLRRLVQQLLETAGAAHLPVTVVPNIAALHAMDAPKDPDARTTLGMVGWGRRVKDPLWALDLLERDPSWRLLLIGPDVPARGASAQAYRQRVMHRMQDPAIRDRVEVVGQTEDVAGHLRRVGVILSTSRRESWHLGLVEGAASGAVPVVRNWPLFASLGGARSLFPDDWVVETVDEAEARVRAVTASSEVWEEERRRARETALALFDPERAAQDYRDVVLGPVPGR